MHFVTAQRRCDLCDYRWLWRLLVINSKALTRGRTDRVFTKNSTNNQPAVRARLVLPFGDSEFIPHLAECIPSQKGIFFSFDLLPWPTKLT